MKARGVRRLSGDRVSLRAQHPVSAGICARVPCRGGEVEVDLNGPASTEHVCSDVLRACAPIRQVRLHMAEIPSCRRPRTECQSRIVWPRRLRAHVSGLYPKLVVRVVGAPPFVQSVDDIARIAPPTIKATSSIIRHGPRSNLVERLGPQRETGLNSNSVAGVRKVGAHCD